MPYYPFSGLGSEKFFIGGIGLFGGKYYIGGTIAAKTESFVPGTNQYKMFYSDISYPTGISAIMLSLTTYSLFIP